MMTIQSAKKSDFKRWAQMRARLWPEATVHEHLADLEEFFRKKNFQGWLAIDKDKAIGFAEAFIRPFANGCDSRPVVFLEGIWVHPSHRKKGIGKQLIKAVEHWATRKKIYELGSDAYLSDKRSHRCHAKWGFQETERVVYFRKKLKA